MKDSFLQQTARAIIEKMEWKQLSRTTLVLPSHRAGLVLKDEILRLQQEQHAQAIWAPQVQTLPQLQDSLSPLYDEDELMTIVRLYKIYSQELRAKSQEPMPLDLFYGWGRQMIADFTNIDASMPAEQVPNFFDNTIAAHELEEWKLDEQTEERLRSLINGERTAYSADRDSVRHQFEQLWKQLYTLYTALHAEMEAESKGYAGMRQRAVITNWEEEAIQAKIAGRTYIFVGFNYLLPVERELMQLLKSQNQALFFWDFVPDFQTNEKAFSFAQQNAGILGNANPSTIQRLTTKDERLKTTLIACTSREAQAQYVHSWLQDNYTANGQKVGVVICDETMLEPVVYALPAIQLPDKENPEPINITKGFPLRNTDIYSRTVGWLNDRQRGMASDIVSPEFIDEMMADLFPVKKETTQTTETTESALSWKELLVLESEYQVRKIINQMRLIVTNGLGDIPFTLKLLRLLMRRTMESVTMPFHGEPVTDIQVMGVLETRLMDFDKLLLINVEEGVIPQKQNDLSFIPFYLRKVYHMQTSDERATVYAYNFFRLLSRAGHSTLMYSTAETSEGGKGMSRFIMQILYSPEFEVEQLHMDEPNTLMPLDQTPLMQYKALRTMLQADNKGILRRSDGKRYVLSPSALNTFVTCPHSFYLQYILGLHGKEDEDVMFLDNTIGSFVHHAMQYLYTHELKCDNTKPVEVKPEQLEALIADEAKLQEALMAAYDEMNRLYAEDFPDEPCHYVPEQHISENVVIVGYMKNILERDKTDAEQGLSLVLLEEPRYFAVDVPEIGQIQTGGIIDRLDKIGKGKNQKLRVVDYKSGSYNNKTHAEKMSATWEELMTHKDKGYVRQTFIYSHAVMAKDDSDTPIEPNLYFCRRKLNDIDTTLSIEDQTVQDYRAISDKVYEALQAKVADILTTTDFPKCDEDDCPFYCSFFGLCGRKRKEF